MKILHRFGVGSSLPRAIVVAAPLVLGGCVVAPPVWSYPTVPPPRAETVPLPPVSEQPLVWRPGDWEWTGNDYRWRDGAWVPRGSHGNMWQYGTWTRVGAAWTWVPGHWL